MGTQPRARAALSCVSPCLHPASIRPSLTPLGAARIFDRDPPIAPPMPAPRLIDRRHLALLSALLLLSPASQTRGAAPVRIWASHLGGAGEDRLESVAYAADGTLLVVGNTKSTGPIGGATPWQIGGNRVANGTESTGFIARLKPDGSAVLSVTRFGFGSVYLTDVAADADYLYAAGYATADFRPQIPVGAYDRTDLSTQQVWAMGQSTSANSTNGTFLGNVYRTVLIRMDLAATQVLDATYLGEKHPRHNGSNGTVDWGIGDYWDPAWTGRGTDPVATGGSGSGMWRYVRGQPMLRFFNNGDLLVAADCGLRWSAGVDAIYRFPRGNFTAQTWKTIVNPVGNNSDLVDGTYQSQVGSVHGFTRLNSISIDPASQDIYAAGTGNGDTGFEPWYDPFVFKYTQNGTQLWGGRNISARPATMARFDAHRTDPWHTRRVLISDSLAEGVHVGPTGNVFAALWCDGGATILANHPWTTGTVTNQDGDSFSGFSGRTQASVTGILNADGVSGWVRGNRLKPYGSDSTTKRYENVLYDLKSVAGATATKAYLVGTAKNVLHIDNAAWGNTTAAGFTRLGFIAGFRYDAGVTTREFATHLVGVTELRRIASWGNGRRFATVGYSFATNATTTPGVFQPAKDGSDDGFIAVFEESLSFANWIATFPELPLADSDPGDDPDQDGLNNIGEYGLLDGDASRSGGPVLPSPTLIAGNLTYPYRPSPTASNVTVQPQHSGNLTGWTNTQHGVGGASVTSANGTVTVSVPAANATFVRLRISTP
jgi:hypothetical protein